MPQIDVIDETFVVAPPAVVATELRAPETWRRLFPGLECRVWEDRGDEGVRLTVTGALVGTNEFWVEPWGDGAIVHYYLRADPARRLSPRRLIAVRERHRVRVKEGLNALKDRLEAGRPPGTPPEWAAAADAGAAGAAGSRSARAGAGGAARRRAGAAPARRAARREQPPAG